MTSGEPDEELDKEPTTSADPYKTLGLSASKHQKSINRFETPAQEHKNQNEASRERSEPKKLAPKVSLSNKSSKPNFMMNKKIADLPVRD